MMDRRRVLVAASSVVGVAVTDGHPDAGQFGIVGDGLADDATAIQAALDHAGQRGGGIVRLPPPAVHYRITRGLTLPSHVVLEGAIPVRYPFNAGTKGACALVADFADPHQWIIESATSSKGQKVPFDALVAGALPDGVTYNCGVRNLLVTSRGKIPFGGIRMHGCPGSLVEGVAIDRVGCGLLVNYSFGGHYQVQTHTLYYGVVGWDDTNVNLFEIYCTQSSPWPKTVPVEYRLPFMVQMKGHFADTLKLSSDDHAARPYGVLCGSIQSTSTGNTFDVVVEQFPGGMFLYNAYATDFRRCYLEANADTMVCAVVASRSRFGIQALHAFLSGTGALFDFGIDVTARIFASGILDTARFGKAPVDDGASLLLFEGIDPAIPGAPIQRGVRYAGREIAWHPLVLKNGWRAMSEDDDGPAVRFDPWSHRVEFRGTLTGGRQGVIHVLTEAWRPPGTCRFKVAGGDVAIDPDGSFRVAPDEGQISLDGVSYARW